MLRRCLESPTPRFGMLMPARAAPTGAAGPGGNSEYGTMLEIRSVQMLADGRSMVETWGAHRFRILERGTLDGYMVGRVERIDDYDRELDGILPPLDDTRDTRGGASRGGLAAVASSARALAHGRRPHPPRAAALSNEQLMDACHSFLQQLREGTAPWVVQRLNNTYGPMPTDPASFSFWMALVSPLRFPASLLALTGVACRCCRSTSTKSRSCCRSSPRGCASGWSSTGSRS